MTGETVSWGPTALVSLFGTMFPAFLEPIRVQDGWAMTIADHREILRFGTGFPMTSFQHTLDDVVRLDFDGNGTMDFVTSGDGIVRRAALPSEYYTTIAAADETTLLAGKPYHYLAVANFSDSTLLDIFYTTKLGQFGIATQTSPDQFTDQVLGTRMQPQRLHIADVDGDGQGDVVGRHRASSSTARRHIRSSSSPTRRERLPSATSMAMASPSLCSSPRTACKFVASSA